jgi:queuine tRNA-ribosyltransferase
MLSINIRQTDGSARRGELTTPHGTIQTPVFMPVGTCGTVKGVTAEQLRATGAEMILANTYHLLLRPGPDGVADLGGVHRMMAWDRPILTDSGGYQVFSLAHMRTLDDDGVRFQSHIDGARVELTPASTVEVQHKLGPDVMMQLDECPPGQADRDVIAAAVERSARWAARCKQAWDDHDRRALQGHPQALFGIQQGGADRELRACSAQRLVELDLPGYAIGGLSVGEGHEAMCHVLDEIDALLPKDRPRYLMGVGEPRDILAAVARGVDMFDCVMPTRNGRNAQAFTWAGRLRLRNACHAGRTEPIEDGCDCHACRHYSRGTIRHLFQVNEMLGPILVTLHNLHFFARFMQAIGEAVVQGRYASFARDTLAAMYPEG